MENYKVKVNNGAESKEVQELLEKLGYKPECFCSNERFPRWVETTDAGKEYWYSTGSPLGTSLKGFKELTIPQLRGLVQSKPTEQALISGADAKLAWANGENVQYFCDEWTEITKEHDLAVFDRFDKYRLKPRTITLNMEIPAPFEPKDGEKAYRLAPVIPCGYTEFYFEEDECEHQFGAWRTEEQIKKVVAALRGAIKNG